MQELLTAMEKLDKDLVRRLADDLFITKDGGVNFVNVQKFERYSRCDVFPAQTMPGVGKLVGWITYNEMKYYYGL